MNRINQISMKILMFISSYFPLYVMLLILNMEEYNSIDKIINLIETNNVRLISFVVTMVLLIIISFFSVFDLKRTKGNEFYKIGKVERPDDTVISYMMTYIVPLLTIDDLTSEVVMINVFLFVLIGYMYIRLNLIYLNPLWSVFGYIMYKTDTDMIIITNIPYRKVRRLNNNRVKGTILAGNIYLIQKEDNDI